MKIKKNIIICALLVQLFSYSRAYAISVVYNFRIAQITRQPIAHQPNTKPDSIAPLVFDFFQKMKNFDIRENYAGGLVTYNHNFIHNYFRADFAVAHTSRTVDKVQTVDVTEPDDILFTAGHCIIHNDNAMVTLSGLLGIPTHSVYTLERVGFGSGQVGLGAQIDGLHKFTKEVDFLWGARYNYFFPRSAFDVNNNAYQFTIGSIADILVALQTHKPLGHGVEGGYSGRWGFGIDATPTIANLDQFNYMRNNVYLVYKYTFLGKRIAHRLLLNISYGSDAKPKLYGYNAVMVWASWGFAF